MKLFDCRIPAERDRGIAAAASAVRRGDLVVLPTDTLYGLGCDAFKKDAVRGLRRVKGQGPGGAAPPVLIGSRRTLDGLAHRLPRAARLLAEAFWPGGLTIIIEHAKSLDWELDDTGTVAVRMPLHPVALELLRETGPMAVTTANKTDGAPPATVAEAKEQLGYSARIYLDGGAVAAPVRSTIVDVTGARPQVLRVGAVTVDRVREVAGEVDAPEPVQEPVQEPAP